MNQISAMFSEAWTKHGLAGAELVPEFVFDPSRKWRADFAILNGRHKILVEIEGFGRHQTFIGYRRDCEKYNAACAAGWHVFRFLAADVNRDAKGVVEELAELICELHGTINERG